MIMNYPSVMKVKCCLYNNKYLQKQVNVTVLVRELGLYQFQLQVGFTYYGITYCLIYRYITIFLNEPIDPDTKISNYEQYMFLI